MRRRAAGDAAFNDVLLFGSYGVPCRALPKYDDDEVLRS